jgi:hypothetical protein
MKIINTLIIILLLTAVGYGQTPVHKWHVIDRGGGKSTSGNVVLHSSIGQPNVTKMTYIDTGMICESGFLPIQREYSGTWMAYSHAFSVGWNLASLPVMPLDPRKSTLYPFATSSAFAYRGSYVAIDTIKPGEGFWVKYSAPASEQMMGTGYYLDTIDVSAGWNMIGGPTSVVPVANIVAIGTSVLSEYFGYAMTYYGEDTLYPGTGFWVKVATVGKLVLQFVSMAIPPMEIAASSVPAEKKSAAKKGLMSAKNEVPMNQIVFRDASERECRVYFANAGSNLDLNKFELPPVPPGDLLDVRYKTNRYLEVADAEKEKSTAISVSSPVFPLRIEWKLAADVGGASLVMNGKEIPMTQDGSLTVDELKGIPKLRLSASTLIELPKKFALYQNFPNPFNPATKIKYDIPTDSRVTIKIYNLIGQEVATLLDDDQEAGYKSVEWNASSLPSGMYIYRITAGSFSDVKKLMLVK